MLTPLYKKLKTNSTTNYVIAQNAPRQPKFTHFALLEIPRQNGAIMDFDGTFTQNTGLSVSPTNFGEQLVESLRNYVANQESVIRGCKINTTTEYYDSDSLTTPTETIFWKWLKALSAFDLEPADATEEYIGSLSQFDDKGPAANTNYFREYLWRERSTREVVIDTVSSSVSPVGIAIVCNVTTKFKPGDTVTITGVPGLTSGTVLDIQTTNVYADTVVIDDTYSSGMVPSSATMRLNYNRLIKYISEITAVSDVETSEKTSTEVYAHIPLEGGMTPTILFRTVDDLNYKPGVTFPILSSEEQWEISGAENPISPIIIDASEYPVDWWGHFDGTKTYTTKSGDSLRRHGDYYGVLAPDNTSPNITYAYPNFDSSNIDGLRLDFDITHYVKPTATSPVSNTFSEFSSSIINSVAPEDFAFNAILWYYETEDATTGKTVTNLYSVTFVNNPDNDSDQTKIPVLDKYVANGTQDGNSFTYALDIEYGVYSTNTPAAFNPTRVYNMFNVDLFTEALKRMALLNDSYTKTVADLNVLAQTVEQLNSKVYSQSSLDALRKRITDTESLLQLYATLQLGNSDSIEAYTDTTVSPPQVKLKSVDKRYGSITQVKSSSMFTNSTDSNTLLTTVLSVPYTITKESNKDFLTIINNDDNVNQLSYVTSPSIPRLEMTINEDLAFKQSAVFLIKDMSACLNKGLDLYINYSDGTTTSRYKFISLDMPVSLIDNSTKDTDPATYYSSSNINVIPDAVYYCKINSTKRTIVIDLPCDMTDLVVGSRLFMRDFKITVGSTTYDMEGLYTVDAGTSSGPEYLPAPLAGVSLLQAGSGLATSAKGAFMHAPSQGSGYVTHNVTTTLTGDYTTDVFTVNGHNFVAGTAVYFTSLTGGTGISTGTVYYVTSISGNTFKLATSLANALAGTAINFTTSNITAGTMVEYVTEAPGTSVFGWHTNGSGVIDSLTLLKPGFGYKPTDSNLIVNPIGNAYVKLVPGARTRIHLVLDTTIQNTNDFVTAMDAVIIATTPSTLNITSTPDGYLEPLTTYMATSPTLDVFKGYEVTLTRINVADNIPLADFDKKYSISKVRI